MSASKSTSAWNRQLAAVNSVTLFANSTGIPVIWPFTPTFLRSYVNWACKIKKLSPSTIRLYISDLKTLHKLKDLETNCFEDYFARNMIKGAENLSMYNSIVKRSRLAMSFPLLKIMGHEIATSDWTEGSKRVIWTAACVAFFGSFRMGELLSPEENSFNSETLTWDCVNFDSDSSAIIEIRFPKNAKPNESHFIDIFKLGDSSICPWNCLKGLHNASPWAVEKNWPVFSFSPKKFLTNKLFTKTVRSLLKNHLGNNAEKISGHSFRAGIPAAIANHPDLLSNDDVRKWGRWSSTSYLAYTRLKKTARVEIFKKLLYALDLK
jgi:hypothetical protein